MGVNRVSRSSHNGFTLVEVMVSVALLLVGLLALLQGFESAIRNYTLAKNRWRTTVLLWNQAERLRTGPPSGEPIQIVPGARPLYRKMARHPEGPTGWEVLRAEK